MASKRTKPPAPAGDIDELFEGLGDDVPKKPTGGKAKAPKGSSVPAESAGADILAELENQLETVPAARPHTPRVKEVAAAAAKGSPLKRPTGTATPPLSGFADEKAAVRKSGDSARSYHASLTPTSEQLGDGHGEKGRP